MNINVLVFLPAYIILILTVAFSEKGKEDKSATIIKTHQYSVSQPMQKIKTLWKIITTAKQ